jgi:hypothetical protein
LFPVGNFHSSINICIWGQSYTIHFTEYPWDEPLYILDLNNVYDTDFPGETFRVFKEMLFQSLRGGQAEHDREVRRVANEYLRKGYKVLANFPNQERPDTFKGVRPDLSVRRKVRETLIGIETPESVESARDEKQKKAFKQWSEKSEHRQLQKNRHRRIRSPTKSTGTTYPISTISKQRGRSLYFVLPPPLSFLRVTPEKLILKAQGRV